jgi:hypothetical protein
MRMRALPALVAATLVAGATLASPAAFADAVRPPPADCSPGSIGQSSHLGPYCQPTTCGTEDDCKRHRTWDDRDGTRRWVCREDVGLCLQDKDFTRWRLGPDAGQNLRPVAVGACGAGGECAAPAKCEVAKRCVELPAAAPVPTIPSASPTATGADPTATGVPSGTGCGCAIGERRAPAGALSAALLMVGLAAARGRRRRA